MTTVSTPHDRTAAAPRADAILKEDAGAEPVWGGRDTRWWMYFEATPANRKP